MKLGFWKGWGKPFGLSVGSTGGGGDTAAPTVAITSAESSPSFANPVPITITFSEEVSGFAVGDITPGGVFDAVSNLATADNIVFTADANVTGQGAGTIDIGAGVCQDLAGNDNEAATQFSITSALFLLDNFTDTVAAGSVNGTAPTPGPGGNRVVIDAENKLSIDGTDAVLAGGKATPANGDPGWWYSIVPRVAGKCLMSKQFLANVTGICYTQWDVNQSGLGTYLNGINGVGQTDENMAMTDLSYTATNDLYQALVMRGTGMFKLVKGGGVYTDWTLLWVLAHGSDANMYPSIANNNKVTNFDYVRGAQLGAPWTTDDGLATQVLAGARSASDTFTHEADCLIYFTVTTLPSADNIEIRFRIQDASNYWQLLIDSSGNYTLNSVAAGTPTARIGPTSGVTNGMRVGIRCLGNNIYVHKANATGGKVTNALYNTETDGELESLGTGGAVTRIEVWPHNISGAALTQLSAMNHADFDGFQVNEATMTNAPARLTIPNGETGGNADQVVHPDVCRPNLAGKWNGYTYWMVVMPYPETDTSKELCFILVSDDMETWIEPPGISNPVGPAPGVGVIRSDNDLFYNSADSKLYIFYRDTDDATYDSINCISSSDGVTWSAATEVLNAGYRAALSPSIVLTAGGTYEMYVIDQTVFNQGVCKVYTSATIGGTYASPVTVFNRSPYSDPQDMWHLDVYLEDGNYLAMITIHNTGDYMWLASSTDGRRWHIADDPLMYKSVAGWDNKWIYRGSIGVRTATGFDVIYSAKSDDGLGDWGAGRTQLTIGVV